MAQLIFYQLKKTSNIMTQGQLCSQENNLAEPFEALLEMQPPVQRHQPTCAKPANPCWGLRSSFAIISFAHD
jgi:hypothetical protein